MPSRTALLSFSVLFALLFLAGCNNTLNPLCVSARPAPLIASLTPSTMDFSQVQQGAVLTIDGSQFVSSTDVIINGKTLGATVTSDHELKVTITTGLITAPGSFKVTVHTPSGNSGDVGCTSGGTSSALTLTVK